MEVLTGRRIALQRLFQHNDGWDLRGEGYSIDVYEIDHETVQYFERVTLDALPKDPGYNSSYGRTFSGWRSSPVESSVVQYATPIYAGWKGELVDRIGKVKDLASKDGSLYSYYLPGSLSFFMIAPQEGILVVIHHNK
jgi:hypothetical protein